MKLLKYSDFTESKENLESLSGYIKSFDDKTKNLLHLIRSENEKRTRTELLDKKGRTLKLNSDIENYFNVFTDEDWDIYVYETEFYLKIKVSRKVKKSENFQKIFEFMRDESYSINNFFKQMGFNSHYMIEINDIPQSEHNKETNKNDIYVFKGLGDEWDPINDTRETIFSKITFVII
jgi:hypothetical protein